MATNQALARRPMAQIAEPERFVGVLVTTVPPGWESIPTDTPLYAVQSITHWFIGGTLSATANSALYNVMAINIGEPVDGHTIDVDGDAAEGRYHYVECWSEFTGAPISGTTHYNRKQWYFKELSGSDLGAGFWGIIQDEDPEGTYDVDPASAWYWVRRVNIIGNGTTTPTIQFLDTDDPLYFYSKIKNMGEANTIASIETHTLGDSTLVWVTIIPSSVNTVTKTHILTEAPRARRVWAYEDYEDEVIGVSPCRVRVVFNYEQLADESKAFYITLPKSIATQPNVREGDELVIEAVVESDYVDSQPVREGYNYRATAGGGLYDAPFGSIRAWYYATDDVDHPIPDGWEAIATGRFLVSCGGSFIPLHGCSGYRYHGPLENNHDDHVDHTHIWSCTCTVELGIDAVGGEGHDPLIHVETTTDLTINISCQTTSFGEENGLVWVPGDLVGPDYFETLPCGDQTTDQTQLILAETNASVNVTVGGTVSISCSCNTGSCCNDHCHAENQYLTVYTTTVCNGTGDQVCVVCGVCISNSNTDLALPSVDHYHSISVSASCTVSWSCSTTVNIGHDHGCHDHTIPDHCHCLYIPELTCYLDHYHGIEISCILNDVPLIFDFALVVDLGHNVVFEDVETSGVCGGDCNDTLCHYGGPCAGNVDNSPPHEIIGAWILRTS